MKSYAANFLWGGKSYQSKYHLVKMDSIAKPKQSGGWGLLDMRRMGNALLVKSFLCGIYGSGPWCNFIKRKYLQGKSIGYWYRRNALGTKRGSAIWLSFCKNKSFILRNFHWKLYSGANAFIGRDLIQDGLIYHLQHELVAYLNFRGIFTWEKLICSWNNSSPIWIEAAELSLPPHFRSMWNSVRSSLSGLPIRRSECKDILVWKLPRAPLPVRVKDIYVALSLLSASTTQPIFPPSLWKVACPTKMILLSWLIFWNRNLTWEVLQRKGWHGPGRCAFCRVAEESNLHMFFQCHTTLHIWYKLSFTMDFPYIVFSSVQEGILWWSTQSAARRSTFLMACWHIWKWRNDSIFDNNRRPVSSILQCVTDLMDNMGI